MSDKREQQQSATRCLVTRQRVQRQQTAKLSLQRQPQHGHPITPWSQQQRENTTQQQWKEKNKQDLKVVVEIVRSGRVDKECSDYWVFKSKIELYGYNILKSALWHGFVDVAKVLLDEGVSVNNATATDQCVYNSIPTAVRVNRPNTTAVRVNKPNATSVHKRSETPLHLAAGKGYKDVVELLLSKGARSNAENKDGQTPLHVAVVANQVEVLKVLLSNGGNSATDKVNVNATDLKGKTALEVIVHGQYRHSNEVTEIVKLLLSSGANKNCLARVLEEAVYLGRENVVKALLEFNTDVNAYRRDKRTHLIVSVIRGNLAMTSLLLQKGVRVNARCREDSAIVRGFNADMKMRRIKFRISGGDCYKTALHYAAAKGAGKTVTALLKHGAHVNCIDYNGKTALHFATEKGYYGIVSALLKRGVQVNLKDSFGLCALHYAIAIGFKDTISALLKHGADVNSTGCHGRTALHIAAAAESCMLRDGDDAVADDTVLALVLNHGADVACADYRGMTALHIAAERDYGTGVDMLLLRGADVHRTDDSGNTSLHYTGASSVTALLSHGADVTSKNCDGKTALHCAAEAGLNTVVLALLEHGAEIESVDNKDYTPLYYAAENGYINVVSVFLKNDVDVGHRDYNGRTLLHVSCARNHENVVLALLNFGAEVDSQDHTGKTPLFYALNGIFYSLQISPDSRCENELINVSAEKNVVFNLLLDYGSKVNRQDENGDTALHHALKKCLEDVSLAVQNCFRDAVSTLLFHGSDVNIKNCSGETALHLAVKLDDTSIILALLDHGAEVDSTDVNGNSALHQAVEKDSKVDTVVALIRCGADVDRRNKLGETALYIATREARVNIVSTLLEYGADLDISVDQFSNHTPLTYAKEKLSSFSDLSKIVDIFVKHVLILSILNIPVNRANKNSIVYKSPRVQNFFSDCKTELALLRKAKVGIGKMTLNGVLTMSDNVLYHLVRKQMIPNTVKSRDYKVRFPLFGARINFRFWMAEKRSGLLDEAAVCMYNLFPSPPGLGVDSITDYLSDRDLKNFIKAFQSDEEA